MKHNRTVNWMLLALTALAAACTADEATMPEQAAAPADGGYTYSMHLDMPAPDAAATRAVGTWADGSQVEFFFYTEVSQTGYKGIPGTATYDAKDDSWKLTTNARIPTNATNKDCEARYKKPGSDPSNDFLTAVYYAATTYTLQGDTAVYASVNMTPCNWRLRLRGERGTQFTLTAANIRHCTGDSLHAATAPQAATATIPLTVGNDGYTSYIYGAFAEASTDATLTVTAGGERYTRTVSPSALTTGKSVAVDIPTTTGYASQGWTLIEDKHTTAPTTPLTFDATPAGPQTIAVTSNEAWTATTSDPEWCSVLPRTSTGSGTITVTAQENTTTAARTATITITGQTSGDVTTITVTQEAVGITLSPSSLTFEATGGSQDITVTSNTSWTATVTGGSWCSVTPNSGTNNGTVTVTAQENTGTATRTATITVTAGDITRTATVTQNGKNQVDITPFGDDEDWD